MGPEPGSDESGTPTQALCGLKAPTKFLTLPLELRMMIYRLLLRSKIAIPESSSSSSYHGKKIYPAILRTCRQVLTEARTILYAENIFCMRIITKDDEEIAWFCGEASHFGRQAVAKFGPRLQDMKQMDIQIQVSDYYEFDVGKSTVRRVVDVLSGMSLDYLYIWLDGNGKLSEVPEVLEPFTRLRGIPELVFDDVPEGYEQWLRWAINGEYPSEPLPVLYDALVAGAAHLDFCRDDLWEAREAMDANDTPRFKRCRDSIVKKIDKHAKQLGQKIAELAESKTHIFDNDVEGSQRAAFKGEHH